MIFAADAASVALSLLSLIRSAGTNVSRRREKRNEPLAKRCLALAKQAWLGEKTPLGDATPVGVETGAGADCLAVLGERTFEI